MDSDTTAPTTEEVQPFHLNGEEKPSPDAFAALCERVDKLAKAAERIPLLTQQAALLTRRCTNLDHRLDMLEGSNNTLKTQRGELYKTLKAQDDQLTKLIEEIDKYAKELTEAEEEATKRDQVGEQPPTINQGNSEVTTPAPVAPPKNPVDETVQVAPAPKTASKEGDPSGGATNKEASVTAANDPHNQQQA